MIIVCELLKSKRECPVHAIKAYESTIWHCVDSLVKSNPWTGPEHSRRLRLPDVMTIGTGRW